MDIDIPADVSNVALLAIVVGFFSPVVLNLILQSGWTARVQAIVAFLFSAVIGTITAWIGGAFDGVGIITGILLVFVVAISTYKGFWKQVTPTLKDATSVNTDGRHEITDVK